MSDEIIKERMLRTLKDSAEKYWGDERYKVVRDLYLTDSKGQCIPDEYLGDDVLRDIHEKFYWYLHAIREEFDEFIEIHIEPSYEDATAYLIICDNKIVYKGCMKAWNFFFLSEEELMEDMWKIYISIAAKMQKTWECWTLSEEAIVAIANRECLSLEGKDLDEIARLVKKGIAWAVDDVWEELIRDAIRNTEVDPSSICSLCENDSMHP